MIPTKFKCAQNQNCQKIYDTKYLLFEHIKMEHSKDEKTKTLHQPKPLNPISINENFEIPAKKVKLEEYTHTKFQCIQSKNCQKSFDSTEQLNIHFQMEHTNANAAPTICKICYIYFETSFQLEDHMKIKHNEQKREILN